MKRMLSIHVVWGFILIITASPCFSAAEPNAPSEESKYLQAVREFADNVLKYGRDTYGPKHTPLFVDGLNIHTHEPVKWISPKGDVLTATETEEWILSNFASQQTLLRTLDGLSAVTGDPKYRDAAMQAIQCAFENLRAPNGLFYWGNMVAYDALAETIRGKTTHHTIKMHYPYYELMWAVDPDATRRFIEAFWIAHIRDWSNLDMNRIGKLDMADFTAKPWDHVYDSNGPVFYKSPSGSIGFLTTGSSLIHAGVTLYGLSKKEEPLIWSKRLAKRYVATRHPNTGISYEAYNTRWSELGDDLKENFIDKRTTFFPFRCFNPIPLGGPLSNYNKQHWPWMSFFLVGQMLDNKDDEFSQWALQEFTAWGKSSYRSRDNVFVPIFTNGVNLESYVRRNVLTRTGRADFVVKPIFAGPSTFWSYAVAYVTTNDSFMWQMTRNIAIGNNFGDIGESLGKSPRLNMDIKSADVYGLLGFLELYAKTKKTEFLSISRRIADNILETKFNKGFFVLSKQHIYSRFDCSESLTLLHLVAAIEPKSFSVPKVWPSLPMFRPEYRYKDELIDLIGIYDLTESPEVSISLQEAVAMGDIDLVTCLIDKCDQLDATEDGTRHTALHRAAIRGNSDIAELLLVKGSNVNAKDSSGTTSLHYVSERGHEDLVRLLISKGANVNSRDGRGRAPLHLAVGGGRKGVVGLLIASGADLNAKNTRGRTPLDLARRRGNTEIAEILTKAAEERSTAVAQAEEVEPRTTVVADVNQPQSEGPATAVAQAEENELFEAVESNNLEKLKALTARGADLTVREDRRGGALLHVAAYGGRKAIVEWLLASGVDVNARDNRGTTPLDLAKRRGHTEIIEILTKAAEEQAKGEK
ncbi:ankyrin repeat domain-containing protein [Planctomycetota bacterium]